MTEREKSGFALALIGAGVIGLAIGIEVGRAGGIREATDFYIKGLLKIAKRKLAEEAREREQAAKAGAAKSGDRT